MSEKPVIMLVDVQHDFLPSKGSVVANDSPCIVVDQGGRTAGGYYIDEFGHYDGPDDWHDAEPDPFDDQNERFLWKLELEEMDRNPEYRRRKAMTPEQRRAEDEQAAQIANAATFSLGSVFMEAMLKGKGKTKP